MSPGTDTTECTSLTFRSGLLGTYSFVRMAILSRFFRFLSDFCILLLRSHDFGLDPCENVWLDQTTRVLPSCSKTLQEERGETPRNPHVVKLFRWNRRRSKRAEESPCRMTQEGEVCRYPHTGPERSETQPPRKVLVLIWLLMEGGASSFGLERERAGEIRPGNLGIWGRESNLDEQSMQGEREDMDETHPGDVWVYVCQIVGEFGITLHSFPAPVPRIPTDEGRSPFSLPLISRPRAASRSPRISTNESVRFG